MRIAVIGAGIIGLSIAWRLAQRNIPVTLIGPPDLSGNASIPSAGMLEPVTLYDETWFARGVESLKLYPGFVRELEEESGLNIDYRPSGILHVARQRSDYPDFMNRYGFPIETLNNKDLARLTPLINPDLDHAIFCPSEGCINPALICAALRRALEKRGVPFIHDLVTGFDHSASLVQGAKTANAFVNADYFIIASGAWSNALFKQLGINFPAIIPVKGQIITLQSHVQLPCVINDEKSVYLVPRQDNKITVGATLEPDAGFDLSIKDDATQWLIEKANALVPSLNASEPLDVQIGLRPQLSNGQIAVETSPAYSNLSYAVGHYRHGILLAPWTANAISRMVS